MSARRSRSACTCCISLLESCRHECTSESAQYLSEDLSVRSSPPSQSEPSDVSTSADTIKACCSKNPLRKSGQMQTMQECSCACALRYRASCLTMLDSAADTAVKSHRSRIGDSMPNVLGSATLYRRHAVYVAAMLCCLRLCALKVGQFCMFVLAEAMITGMQMNVAAAMHQKWWTAHHFTTQSQQLLVLPHAFRSLRSLYVHAATKLLHLYSMWSSQEVCSSGHAKGC